jgi:hypothetical protein
MPSSVIAALALSGRSSRTRADRSTSPSWEETVASALEYVFGARADWIARTSGTGRDCASPRRPARCSISPAYWRTVNSSELSTRRWSSGWLPTLSCGMRSSAPGVVAAPQAARTPGSRPRSGAHPLRGGAAAAPAAGRRRSSRAPDERESWSLRGRHALVCGTASRRGRRLRLPFDPLRIRAGSCSRRRSSRPRLASPPLYLAPDRGRTRRRGCPRNSATEAVRVGFEPTIRFPAYTLSKRAP